MSTFSSRSSEIQNPFFVFLLSDFSKTTPFFVKSPLRTLATAELFRIIGSNSSFHPPDCPHCEKPETARTAGRSGRAGGDIVPGSFSCFAFVSFPLSWKAAQIPPVSPGWGTRSATR